MLNFASLPLRSDVVQILFLVKYATVKGYRPVKRLQYDDVCNGQVISDSSPLKRSGKPLLIPELEDVKYNTYVLSSKIALLGTFDGIIFVRLQFTVSEIRSLLRNLPIGVSKGVT